MRRLWLAAFLLLPAATVFPERFALADPDAAAQAQVIFNEALALVARAKTGGDARVYDEAIGKFLAAYRLSPRPNALFNAALTEEKIGRPADAMHHFRQLSHNPACGPVLAAQIDKHLAELGGKVAVIQLDAPAGADIAVDGGLTGEKAPLPDPIDLLPGKHTIEARMNVSASIEIDAVAGTKQTLRIGFGAPPAEPQAAAPTQGPLLAASSTGTANAEATTRAGEDTGQGGPPFWNTRRVLGLSVAGLGVASLVLSAVFESQSSSDKDKASSIRAGLSPSSCYGPVPAAASDCASLNDAYSGQNRDEDLSRVFLGVGVGAAVAGAALFFWPQSAPARASVAPFPVRQGAGLALQGEL